MLQAFFLTALTVAFPFRIWTVMLASAEIGDRARRSRELREAIIFHEVRNELMAALPVALEPPVPPSGGLA